MPHFGHVILLAIVEVMDGVLIDLVIAMSSRSVIGTGRRDTGADVHTVRDIDPDEPANMSFLLALDRTQAASQSFCLNDIACKNM